MKKNTKIIISIVGVLCLLLFCILGYFIFIRSTYISKDEVKDIIIKDTKLNKQDITFKEIELDTDDYIKKYDVEFYYNRTEYKYEVDAKSGNIIYSNFMNNNTSNNENTNTNTNNYISEEEAREIALNDASLNASDVTFTDIDLDLKNGNAIYEVDFESNTLEYEYTIDGISKTIINKKQESRD